jgi:hypothetical protein
MCSFLYCKLSARERSTYDRIQSELDALSKRVEAGRMTPDMIVEFCAGFESAKKAKNKLIKNIAESYGIPVDRIITINNGLLFFKNTKLPDIASELVKENEEDLNGKKYTSDSVEIEAL